MTRGVADIVEVVVLAAGTDAFLRGGGALVRPLLDAGKDVLELHHAGIGEHQGRVVARHQGRRIDDLMAVGREIIQKCRPDLVNAAHISPNRAHRPQPRHRRPSGPYFSSRTLLDGGACAVQKLCKEIRGLPRPHRDVDRSEGALTSRPGRGFVPAVETSRRERSARSLNGPAPKEQPPRKLSGKRTV